MNPSRRGFLLGMGALLAAPAIVRAGALMPIRPGPPAAPRYLIYGFVTPLLADGGLGGREDVCMQAAELPSLIGKPDGAQYRWLDLKTGDTGQRIGYSGREIECMARFPGTVFIGPRFAA